MARPTERRRVLGVAVIGAGSIGPSHAEAVVRNRNARLVAVVDRVTERAREVAARGDVQTLVANDISDILALPELDAVAIATPHDTHAELARGALSAGKHVLIEKPVAITDAEMRKITRAAGERPELIVAVAHQMRFRPLLHTVKQVVDGRELGELLTIQLELACSRTSEYFTASGWRGRWRTEGARSP